MTPARTASYGLGNPPSLQLWLHAVLMLFAELVSRAVSTLQMVFVCCMRDWHTEASPDDLPRETNGIQQQETLHAENTGAPKALMPSSARRARPSKHEGRLTALSIVIPAEARKREEREPRGDARRHPTQHLASGSRASRAFGMTRYVGENLA